MNRGDVFWVDFEPGPGGEIRKQRPAVIVSNDGANRVQVVPLTSNTSRIYVTEPPVLLAGRRHKALAIQVRTVAKERLANRIGMLASQDIGAVARALRIQLDLT
jgi:mRNA interferase MazF